MQKVKDNWVLIGMASLLIVVGGLAFLLSPSGSNLTTNTDDERQGVSKPDVWVGRKGNRYFTENVSFKLPPGVMTASVSGGVLMKKKGFAGSVMETDLTSEMTPGTLKRTLGGGRVKGRMIVKSSPRSSRGFLYIRSWVLGFDLKGEGSYNYAREIADSARVR